MAVTYPPRALTIPEILLEILLKLSSKDLVTSALVCRAWLAPAVETKWRTQIILLSRLLTRLAPLVKDTQDHTRKFILNFEDMTEERWTFFLENYSNRVTRLEVDIALDLESVELLRKLLKEFGGRLGSGLSALDYTPFLHRDNHSTSLLDLLIGPNVLGVGLPNFVGVSSAPRWVTTVKHRAPSVTKLKVTSLKHSIDYSGFSRLRNITHIGILSPSDYIALSNCPDLQSLDWYDTSNSPLLIPTSPSIEAAVPTFSSLRELRIQGYSIQLEDLIFRSITPRLHTVAFKNFNRQLNVPALDHFLKRCVHLDDLDIKVNAPGGELAKMGHGNVRRLHIENREWMGHDSQDDEFNWIGSSYPKLQELTLGCGIRIAKRSEWGILASLVPVCDELKKLTLPLHISTFELSDATSPNIQPLESLTTLRLETIAIGAAVVDDFARYLAMMCPNVRTFEVGDFFESPVSNTPPEGQAEEQVKWRPFSEEKKELFMGNFCRYQKTNLGPFLEG
ncbi:hypothetical protein FRB98_003104 [Tulasnella sp. 332]|nr:hypothetical protein FRB98_003104 [Tulasnella sp. 332]